MSKIPVVDDVKTTGLITVHHSFGMDTAYQLLRKNRIRHLPVVNDTGEVIGILSDRDIQRAMRSQIVTRAEGLTSETIDFDPAAAVRDYMSWPVRTLDRNTLLKVAAEKMVQEKISALLVMDGSRVIGILTSEDLLKVLIDLLNAGHGPELDVESILRDPRWGFSNFSPL